MPPTEMTALVCCGLHVPSSFLTILAVRRCYGGRTRFTKQSSQRDFRHRSAVCKVSVAYDEFETLVRYSSTRTSQIGGRG